MRKKITILLFVMLFLNTNCGIAKPIDSAPVYEQEEKVMKGLLFGLVTYALYSIISNH